ncbi:jg1367, partial [Pararge aegeria aegeria]
MARHLSRLQIVFTLAIIGAQGKHVNKRSLEEIQCYENGRFYR